MALINQTINQIVINISFHKIIFEKMCTGYEFLLWCYNIKPGSEVETECFGIPEGKRFDLSAKFHSDGGMNRYQRMSFHVTVWLENGGSLMHSSQEYFKLSQLNSMSKFCGRQLSITTSPPEDHDPENPSDEGFTWLGLALIVVLVGIGFIFCVYFYFRRRRAVMRS